MTEMEFKITPASQGESVRKYVSPHHDTWYEIYNGQKTWLSFFFGGCNLANEEEDVGAFVSINSLRLPWFFLCEHGDAGLGSYGNRNGLLHEPMHIQTQKDSEGILGKIKIEWWTLKRMPNVVNVEYESESDKRQECNPGEKVMNLKDDRASSSSTYSHSWKKIRCLKHETVYYADDFVLTKSQVRPYEDSDPAPAKAAAPASKPRKRAKMGEGSSLQTPIIL